MTSVLRGGARSIIAEPPLRALLFSVVMAMHSLCHAQIILRFQPHITTQATYLGDILNIQPDKNHWSALPLDSHPAPNEHLTKDQLITWMSQQVGLVKATWQGKTEVIIQPIIQSSEQALVEKATAALLHDLAPHYTHVEVQVLSHPNGSEYPLETIHTNIRLTYPTRPRVCVWLTHEAKRIPVWFKVHAYNKVWVANRSLPDKSAAPRDAFIRQTRNIAGLHTPPATSLPNNSWLTTPIKHHAILLENQLGTPPLVTQGQHVNVTTHHQHITLNLDLIALNDGRLGDHISVKQLHSQDTFLARVSGAQQAELIA